MILKKIIRSIEKSMTPLSVIVFIVVFLDLGLKLHTEEQVYFRSSTTFFEFIYTFFFVITFFVKLKKSKHLFGKITRIIVWILSVFLLIATGLGLINSSWGFIDHIERDIILLLISFIVLSHWLNRIEIKLLHPSLIFILSFVFLIVIGTILLLLPNSTHDSISLINALFTATSAVTVTGLAVVDTANDFTQLGQTFIMFLFQIGGLGMLTFTNLLVISMGNKTSFRTRLMIGEFVNEENINSTFRMLVSIIVFTFLIEFIGAVFVYQSVIDTSEIENKVFFSVFHAISAFCNAGFSTLQNSFYEETVRFNYNLQLVIGILIIIGAMGFNVSSFYINKARLKLINKLQRITGKGNVIINNKKQSVNALISVRTTFILIFIGMVMFYFLEKDHALENYDTYGKLVSSFFNSVTTRTAGFNTLDLSSLSIPTLMIFMLLMWIGAAPGSTGGGIKTTTFAVASLNIVKQVTRKKHLMIYWREISEYTISRMFAVISLSLIAIGLSCFLLLLFDPQIKPVEALFECFSAYSTVGLSLGITAQLSFSSKLVLIVVMFIGRISFLTFLSGLILQLRPYRKKETTTFKAPKINIYS
ncbi:ktr system potassium uptake protein B [Flavobacteriaceae bacterium UJ101]|nr:ktr system potassium uptake protein B [Flavobacteriaceae bacterium UJ101]